MLVVLCSVEQLFSNHAAMGVELARVGIDTQQQGHIVLAVFNSGPTFPNSVDQFVQEKSNAILLTNALQSGEFVM